MTCLLASGNQYGYIQLALVCVIAEEMHAREREFQDAVMQLVELQVNW